MKMYKEKLALYIALVTLTNGWVSTTFLEDKNKQLQSLVRDNRELKQKLDKYETEGSAYYSSARLWDDGIIGPCQTRKILGYALQVSMNAEIRPTRFGVFRM